MKPWRRARDVDDVEFVDRYLHPQETSYDVKSLWDLLDGAGLRFLRWVHQEEWESTAKLCRGPVRERFEALAPRERYRFAQELLRGGKLQLYACLPGNGPRPELDPTDVERAGFAVHPEGTFELVTRGVRGSTRIERLTWRDLTDTATSFPPGPLACAGLILREQNLPFDGKALVEALMAEGIERAAARAALLELLRRGVLGFTPPTWCWGALSSPPLETPILLAISIVTAAQSRYRLPLEALMAPMGLARASGSPPVAKFLPLNYPS